MARPGSKYPTEVELQILKLLWGRSPLLAREVPAALAGTGPELAKTSRITTLNTMVGKKYLTRRRQGHMFLFAPRITDETVSRLVLDDVVDRVFDGSAAAVVLRLCEAEHIDEKDLRELRRLIDRKLKGQ